MSNAVPPYGLHPGEITWAPRGNHVGPHGQSRGPPGENTGAPRSNHVGPQGKSQQRFGEKVFDLLVVLCQPVLLTLWMTWGRVVPHFCTRGRTHKAVLICTPASSFPSCPGLKGTAPPAEPPWAGSHSALLFVSPGCPPASSCLTPIRPST